MSDNEDWKDLDKSVLADADDWNKGTDMLEFEEAKKVVEKWNALIRDLGFMTFDMVITVNDFMRGFWDGFKKGVSDIEKCLDGLGIYVKEYRLYSRETVKARERSRRNNLTVKRHKHGRTQRTRVRR